VLGLASMAKKPKKQRTALHVPPEAAPPRDWLAAIGKRGGAATSAAKGDAARSNGRLGGRPRKAPKVGKPTTPDCVDLD
jgi:hypothetical protein